MPEQAHDSTGSMPAHRSTSEPPSIHPTKLRPKHMNLDSSGVSMSWKTAAAILTAVVMGMLGWSKFNASLARTSALVDHDQNESSHMIALGDHQPSQPIANVVRNINAGQVAVIAELEGVKKDVRAIGTTSSQAVAEIHESRAEDLAYRAIENLPNSVSPRARVETFERVKRKAIDNLKSGKPAREGQDDLRL